MPIMRSPTRVRNALDWRLYRSVVLAVLSAIAIVMGLSQLTGYNLYTGDELQSTVTERIQKNLQEEQRSQPTDAEKLDSCLNEAASTSEDEVCYTLYGEP
jgi:hypothetical protein